MDRSEHPDHVGVATSTSGHNTLQSVTVTALT